MASELVCTQCRREKSLPCRQSNPGRPALIPSLYRLSYPNSLKEEFVRKSEKPRPIDKSVRDFHDNRIDREVV
jgi:hypothetical protein